ncbi:AI-2E family transporter [Candidatus Pacearchaeota archaeon]|nr:AI-2E family transporter [Candidatus Pacearchaeota archaeon]
MNKEKFRFYFATIIVLILSAFLLYTIYMFAEGFFGGLLLYVVLFPLYDLMIKKGWGKKLSAWIIVFISLFVIILPLLFLLGLVGNELFSVFQDPNIISDTSEMVSKGITKIFPGLSKEILAQQLIGFGKLVSSLFLNIALDIGDFIINLIIALFLLFFMLTQGPIYDKIKKVVPFNEKNSNELVDKLKDISYSTVFVGGIIALIQGGLLAISFLIFGIQGAFLWGFVTAILSFFPVIGPPFVWIPAAVIQFFQGDYRAGGGILIFGLILSNIDNLIRPYLAEKISKIHPLVSLVGIFVGVLSFGVMGIFIGPLLLALTILILRMFEEEYYG